MPPPPLMIALVQMACGADLQTNLAAALARVEEAARQGATVVCLPELFRSPYFCQQEDPALFDLAEAVPGPSTDALRRVAGAHHVVILVPVFERRAPGIYHSSVVVIDRDGSLAGRYRKMHIPDDPAYYEKYYFTPGDAGFQAIPTQVGTIGPLICWDQWYPEAARLTTLKGAEMLFYPTAIGWHPSEKKREGEAQRSAWHTMHRSHAIANGVFVAAVNRVGHEPSADGGDGLEFWGNSFICDPFGVVLAEASVEKEEIVLAEIDLGQVEEVRRHWPFLRDRRIDAYGGMTSRFLDRDDDGHCQDVSR